MARKKTKMGAKLKAIRARLKYLRREILAERISYGEISELQDLARYIEPGDMLLLQWAGVPESKAQRGLRRVRSNPSWTRQHFVLIARVLSALRADAASKGASRQDFEVLDIVTRDFAYALAQTKPQFNMSTFLKASGYGKRGM